MAVMLRKMGARLKSGRFLKRMAKSEEPSVGVLQAKASIDALIQPLSDGRGSVPGRSHDRQRVVV